MAVGAGASVGSPNGGGSAAAAAPSGAGDGSYAPVPGPSAYCVDSACGRRKVCAVLGFQSVQLAGCLVSDRRCSTDAR